MWIYQHHDWPHFTWDAEKVTSKLVYTRHQQGLLLGKMQNLGFALRQEASLCILTDDIIQSSAIEGHNLIDTDVRSSVAERLGIEIAGLSNKNRHVDGIVDMMLDATQNFETSLSKKRLFNWHAALFPTGRSGLNRITVGAWRTLESGPMQVISGGFGRQKIHFEAPSAEIIDHGMTKFLQWFEKNDSTLDPVLKAGIAHFWFVTLHPFEDGNGRIARAIADMALTRADGIAERFYSLSTQIASFRKQYYNILERQQRGNLDITEWLLWFLGCIDAAIHTAESTLSHVLFRARFWQFIQDLKIQLNERQHIIIGRMLEKDFKGYMNTSKYAKMAKCSNDTALRDIQDLKSIGLVLQNDAGGRSTSYRLIDPPKN